MIGLPLSDGNTATLNFTIHDVNDYRETFQDEAAGIILEYGSVDEDCLSLVMPAYQCSVWRHRNALTTLWYNHFHVKSSYSTGHYDSIILRAKHTTH